jgi:voltage-dependent potassium channel beta subunit
MRYRQLGKWGMKVSEIALGAWVTYGDTVHDKEVIAEIVKIAYDGGVNFFDNADIYAYGKAEEIMGEILADYPRHTLVLSTKAYWPMSKDVNDRGLSRKHIMESAHGSLRRLQTDYIDIYQAHRFDHHTPLEETLGAFDDLIRQGKVLYIGVSEWRAEEIRRALALAEEMGLDRFVSNQPQYSMLWRVIEAEVVPECESAGMGQVVWSPLAQGVLTGKYLPGAAIPEGSRAADPTGSGFIAKWLEEDVLTRVQGLRPLAEEAGLTMAQMAVAWVLGNPNVSAAIVGASRPEQLQDTVQASGVVLDDDLREAIDDVLGDAIVRDPALTASPAQRP